MSSNPNSCISKLLHILAHILVLLLYCNSAQVHSCTLSTMWSEITKSEITSDWIVKNVFCCFCFTCALFHYINILLWTSNKAAFVSQTDLRTVGRKYLPSDINSGRTEKVSGIHIATTLCQCLIYETQLQMMSWSHCWKETLELQFSLLPLDVPSTLTNVGQETTSLPMKVKSSKWRGEKTQISKHVILCAFTSSSLQTPNMIHPIIPW